MSNISSYPREFRIPASQDHVRSLKNPHFDHLAVIHAFVKVSDLPNGDIPDKINPRSHEKLRMTSRIPEAIEESIQEDPELFHLLNRGCLILAKKAWYDNQSKTLHFIIESDDEYGMVDGATTDRVLQELKKQVSNADFTKLTQDEIPDCFKASYIHLEIIAGDLDRDLRVKLADARNTSEQVKEFSLEDLRDNFSWLKEVLESSELRGRVRYRENEQQPVDVRTVLALLTLFHPLWQKKGTEPVVAYTGKGAVLELYTNDKEPEWIAGYKKLAPVVVDILKLYEYLHSKFQEQYMKAYGEHSKLGKRKEVRFIESPKKPKELPLTHLKTRYVLPDGWLYPLLASFRILLEWPNSGKGSVKWLVDPVEFFDEYGSKSVEAIIETSSALGSNPNSVGKNRQLWENLREKVENQLYRLGKNLVQG